MTRLTADRTRCRGAGQCVSQAPTLFDQDDSDGLVLILVPHPTPAQLPSAHRALSFCPTTALSLTEDDP